MQQMGPTSDQLGTCHIAQILHLDNIQRPQEDESI